MKSSDNRYAEAPGVTNIQITKKAPTVFKADIHAADKIIKNINFKRKLLIPIAIAYFSSKKTKSNSFHLINKKKQRYDCYN